ncbi:MAG: DUF2141 domain-containing protein [Alphaproteobacteria bacterium]|nr:DUF2141 domain-containing protein [Alphaproteobacteria bacterium]
MAAALILAAMVAAAPVPAAPAADTATLTVKVAHVSPKGGEISLALYTAANYDDDDHPTLSRDVPADPAGTTIVIDGLKPGVYAIKMMQDINRNGKFDTSWLGLPLEPYGFSNNAKPFLSAPSFDSTKFTVAPGDNTITIRLSGTDGISVPKRKEPVK